MAPLDEHSAVRRLLDRFGFGPRPGELATATERGFAATVDQLLDANAVAADPGARSTPPPDLGAEPARPRRADAQERKRFATELREQETRLLLWWLDRMVAVTVPSAERLTWFWHGHFATGEQKVAGPGLMLAQNETFRRLGLGDFGTLADAMITDPALLVWLDAQQNRAGAPNENLAREFLELFALGIGRYTERDVREAARALTGWTVDRAQAVARVVPKRHDDGTKTILGATADFTAQSFVELVLSRQDSARFVAGRLWFRLVSGTAPPPDVLDRLVAGYGPNRDIRGLLRAIAAEPAFRDGATTIVKQPVEWLVGLLRALDLRPSTLPAAAVPQLVNGLHAMGQVPFQPPNVGGWPSGPAWLTTSAGAARLRLARLVAGYADLGALRAGSPAARIDAAAAVLGLGPWSTRTRTALSTVSSEPQLLCAVAACAPEYVISG